MNNLAYSENIDDLARMLDDQGVWVVRNGSQILRPVSTLREALHKAYNLSMQGNFSGPIVKDKVTIDAHQIHHLWQYLGFKVN